MSSLICMDNGLNSVLNLVGTTNGNITITAKVSIPANNAQYLTFIPQTSGALYGYVGNTSITARIFDSNGNLLIIYNTANFINLKICDVVANQTYYLGLVHTATTIIDVTLFNMQLYETPLISDYFEGGFSTIQPFIAGVTSSTDASGTVTFNFNAVTLTKDQTTGLNLGYSGIATKTGTITLTSSDASVFPSVSDNFVPNVVFQFQFKPLKTTVFTGTIVVSVTGAGELVPVFTIPVGYNGWNNGIASSSSLIKRPRKTVRHFIDLNNESKKVKTEESSDGDMVTTTIE